MATPCEYVMGDMRLKRVSRPVRFGQALTGLSASQLSAGLREDQAWCLQARFGWKGHDV